MNLEEQSDLLARLDERTETILKRMDGFVSQEEFSPLKRLVYGLVSIILGSVVVALLGLVVIRPALAVYIALLS